MALEDQKSNSTKRLRQACDACHGAKTKCCGSSPCTRCQRSGDDCVYSQSNRAGRPKGTKNKKSGDGSSKSSNSNNSSSNSSTNHSRSHSTASPRATAQHRGSYSEVTGVQVPNQQDLNAFAYQDFGPSSMGSFASGMSSPPIPSQQRNCVNSIPFDFNPSHDFPMFTGSFQDPNAMFQQDYPFPVMGNMNVNMMDLCPRLSVDTNAAEIQSGMIPSGYSNLTLPFTDADFSAISPSQILRDSILQSIEQDGIPILIPGSEPLSQVTTNSNSIDSKCSTNSSSQGSPALPHSWLSNDTAMFKAPNLERLSNAFSPLLASNGDTMFEEARCQCLHRHAKLLTHLQELLKGLSELPVDTVLNGVEQGLKSWDSFLQCRICQQDQHREVLLLSAMSIRAVTRLLQGSSTRMFTQSRTADWLNDHDVKPSTSDMFSKQRNARLTLGSYEIKGEEGLLVLGVVFSRILAKIGVVLGSLKQSLPSIGFGEQDLRETDTYTVYLHKLFEGLEADVSVLSANLRNWSMEV
jgi:hypothetical protein